MRSSSVRARATTVALVLVGVAVGVAVVAPQTGSSTGLLDLRIYLGAARAVHDGLSAYSYAEPTYHLGSTYPPLWSLVLAPVAGIDVHVAEYAWTGVNLVLWFATLRLVSAGTARGARPVLSTNQLLLVWLVSLPSAPVWNTLNQGQINILLWFLLALDLRLVARRDPRRGMLIGLGTALKLVPLVAVALLVVARRWRAALVALATFVVVTGVVALVARDDSREYWTKLLFDTTRIGSIDDAQNNSLRAVIERVGLSGRVEVGVWVVLTAIVVLVAGAHVRRALQGDAPITAAVMVGAAMSLASPISWTHHLVFLGFLLPLVVPGRTARRAGVATVAVVVVAILLVDPIGFGRMAATSTVRTFVLVALVLAGGPLLAHERRWRGFEVSAAPSDDRRPSPVRR